MVDIKLVQTAQLREISKLRLQTERLMQALLEARQQLQAAESELEKARELIQKALDNELYCLWCFLDHKTSGHQPDCPAAAWLEAGEETAEGKE